MTFRVEQKVICIDVSNGFSASHIVCPLRLEEVYTVLATEIVEGYLTVEVDGDRGRFWSSRRFRPAVQRETEVSNLIAVLKSSEVDA